MTAVRESRRVIALMGPSWKINPLERPYSRYGESALGADALLYYVNQASKQYRVNIIFAELHQVG